MNSIQIGSFILNGQLILYLSYGAAGLLMLRYRFRHTLENRLFISCATNAFLLWLLVWKGSFLIFHLFEFIRQPISLLYFDGGERGRWMATLVAAAYIWHRSSKQKLSKKKWIDIGTWFTMAGWLVYLILMFVIGEEPSWFHAVSAGMSAVLLTCLLIFQKVDDFRNAMTYMIWFLLGNTLMLFTVSDRPVWLLAFSKQQTIFLLAAACLTGWSWFDERMRKGGVHG